MASLTDPRARVTSRAFSLSNDYFEDPVPTIAVSITLPLSFSTWRRGREYAIHWETQGPLQFLDVTLHAFVAGDNMMSVDSVLSVIRREASSVIASGIPNEQQTTFAVPSSLPRGTYLLVLRDSQSSHLIEKKHET